MLTWVRRAGTVLAFAGLFACGSTRDDSGGGQSESLTRNVAAPLAPFGPLALGDTHTCVMARRGVTCWGNNVSGQLNVPVLRHPTQLTSGDTHACALDDDGVKCWGRNTSQQTTVPAMRLPKVVSAGSLHTCAVDADGVKCWGSNASMQTNVPALREPRLVTAGGGHTCALDADGVKCWGKNINGQTTVPALRNPRQLALGANHSCALDDDGVKCWGNNLSMQSTVPPLKNPTQLTTGSNHTCALDDDGVKCWGRNASGQTAIPALHNPTQVAAGNNHTCALDDEDVVCWGSNVGGEIVVPSDVALFGRHACVLANGGLRCTGDNERGQLGVGSDQDQLLPLATAGQTDLGPGFGAPTQIAIGHAFGCALAPGGVKCWGSGDNGRLGLSDPRDRGLAKGEMGDALPALQLDGPATKIDVGDAHACAIGAQGVVFCWGKGNAGQLGTEAADDAGAPTRPHLPAGFKARDLALGRAHTCVVATNRSVYCFGNNAAGQLGLGRAGAIGDRAGTMGDAMQPVALGAGFRVKSLASGDRHTCALSEDGRIKCWGAAESGQLGLGDTKNRGTSADDMGDALPAVDLGQGQFAVDVDCGGRHCCARTVQNTMKCWGDNSDGQLGLGDVAVRGADAASMGDNLPFVMTPPLERVLSIQLEGNRTCARTDSGLRCWGRNRSGELGYGDRDPRGNALTTVPRLLAPLGI
jgi:alpha-tubulin suppressor-like RCC1 family protein